jgi:excisionase family DNA binding protein
MDNPFEKIMAKLSEIEQQLANIQQASKSVEKPSHEEYLTRAEAAACLKITTPTLLQRTLSGEIKMYRSGRRVLFKRSEIDEYINNKGIKTNSHASSKK